MKLSPLAAALVVALISMPLLAVEIDDNARHNAASAPQAAIPWLSGGVGDEALAEMHKVAASYNVQVIFSGQNGRYLASVPFSLTGADGREILAGVSEGPLLYLKLKPGSYRFSANIDHQWQNEAVRIGPANGPVKLSFVSRGE